MYLYNENLAYKKIFQKKGISRKFFEEEQILEKISREGCVVFMRLGENYCQIVKASSNLEKITGYKNEEILFERVETIIPSFIAEKHTLIVDNYL